LDDAVVVALGANLADGYASCEALLEAALEALAGEGVRVLRRSRWWRSAAWPNKADPEFRNGVALVATQLSAQALLKTLHKTEAAFGRRSGPRNAPRTLDLDLIAYGRMAVGGPGLILPHPQAHERLFVLGPLAEIAPAWVHPTLGRTAEELAAAATVGRDATPQT
jgi:2-amino-4-hydroxy-6-hydroxymethyldihydropteridine diphosphokinase